LFADDDMADVMILSGFVQLMDDDIVSLIALTLIADPGSTRYPENVCIYQLTLSLYLMTQCQLKLRDSVTSLAQTLDNIEVAEERNPTERRLDHLTLKLIERKVVIYLINSRPRPMQSSLCLL